MPCNGSNFKTTYGAASLPPVSETSEVWDKFDNGGAGAAMYAARPIEAHLYSHGRSRFTAFLNTPIQVDLGNGGTKRYKLTT